jgi:hypothetical protein
VLLLLLVLVPVALAAIAGLILGVVAIVAAGWNSFKHRRRK